MRIPEADWNADKTFNGVSSKIVCAGLAEINGHRAYKIDEEAKTCEMSSSSNLENEGNWEAELEIYISKVLSFNILINVIVNCRDFPLRFLQPKVGMGGHLHANGKSLLKG